MTPRRPLLLLAFAAVCIVWGSTYLAIRVAVASFPPFLIGAVRFLVAGSVLLVVARVRGEALPTRAQWGSALLTGGLFFMIGNGLINVAERSVSSGVVSVLVATMPLWATLFSRLFGQRVSARELAGVGIGLAGVVVINLGGDLRASPGAVAFGLLAPMGWAMGSIANNRLPLPQGVMRTASQMLCGGSLMLALSTALGETAPAPRSARAVFAVAYLCVFGSLVGFSAYSYLLKHARPAVATSYAYVNPVIAVALGVALGGERFGLASAAGTAIVLAAVVLVRSASKSTAATEPSGARTLSAGIGMWASPLARAGGAPISTIHAGSSAPLRLGTGSRPRGFGGLRRWLQGDGVGRRSRG